MSLCIWTGSGKENLLTNVKPSFNPLLLQRIFRARQDRRGASALAVSDRGGTVPSQAGEPALREASGPEEALGFVLHDSVKSGKCGPLQEIGHHHSLVLCHFGN